MHADRFCDRIARDLLPRTRDRRISESCDDADRKRDLLQAEPTAGNASHVANEGKALPLPPVIPDDRRHLERAITLLGCRARGELGASARAELTGLVGCYPSARTALEWKRSLKLVRDDEIFGRTG